ncbi:unnamed protein product, partial [Staurois parvus]
MFCIMPSAEDILINSISLHFGLGGCRTPDLCLDSAYWPRADHMHSPKKKNSLALHTKLSMCIVTPHDMSYQEIREGHWKKGRIRKVRVKQCFYTMQRINPLGSTVSITSMLCCIYRLIYCCRF